MSTTELETDFKQGRELIEQIVAMTGLPREHIQTELHRIVAEAGHCPESITMDQLRSAMMQYLSVLIGNEEDACEPVEGKTQ